MPRRPGGGEREAGGEREDDARVAEREEEPTLSGGRSVSPPSLRVTLSIAAMWSASNACRIPSE